MTHAEYEAEHGADPVDIARVEEFAGHFGLAVKAVLPAQRSILLGGTTARFSEAFRVALHEHYLPDNTSYRGRDGTISIPEDLGYCVVGVFGLDNRRVAWPQFRAGGVRRQADASGAKFQSQGAVRAFFPNELARMYNFPDGVDGTGQTIGLVELGGGFQQADLDAYFAKAGVHPPAISVGTVVGGATNQPAPDDPDEPDIEVLLDMEVVGAAAPGAKMVVYFVKDGTDQQCLLGVSSAVHDRSRARLSVLSLSWGGPEFEPGSSGDDASNLQKQFQDNLNDMLQSAAHLGITVCVSSGDNASASYPSGDFQRPWDGHAHVCFPASSPFALACGGTYMSDPDGPAEEAWHPADNDGTGGGVSRILPGPRATSKAS